MNPRGEVFIINTELGEPRRKGNAQVHVICPSYSRVAVNMADELPVFKITAMLEELWEKEQESVIHTRF